MILNVTIDNGGLEVVADTDRAEAIQEMARNAYEWECMGHPCGLPFAEMREKMAGPLAAYEKFSDHVRVTLEREPLVLRGVEFDLYLDTWSECVAFHAETDGK